MIVENLAQAVGNTTSAPQRSTARKPDVLAAGRVVAIFAGALALSGCIGVPKYFAPVSGSEPSSDAVQACRAEARSATEGGIDSSPPDPSNSEMAGGVLGNSLGNAVLFRRTYVKCMERNGYVRRD